MGHPEGTRDTDLACPTNRSLGMNLATSDPRQERNRERRLRRLAHRKGLHLHRSRTRTPQFPGFGTYGLSRCELYGAACTAPAADLEAGHWRSHVLVAGDREHGHGLSLDDVERHLTDG
jgi:hypothetical protein